MSIKASATITLSFMVDIKAVYRYYKLQSSTASAPSVPTVYPPTGWTDAEPSYTSGSTNTLYFVDLTVFTNDTYLYSAVSKSSSYEAAKEAYNKAEAASTAANTVQSNLNKLEIGGRNLLTGSKSFNATSTYGSSLTGESYNGSAIRYLYNGSSSTHSEFAQWTGIYPHRLGETYTFSFYAKGSGRCTLFFYGPSGCVSVNSTVASTGDTSTLSNGQIVLTLTSEWTRYWVTWTLAETGNISIQKYLLLRANAYAEMYVCGPKLEVGGKSTDWSEAPEDIDNHISDAAKTATNYLKVDGGLIVGDHTKSTLGKNVLIDDDSMDIRDGGDVLASYGSSSIEFKKQVIFKADGMKIDNGDALCNLGQNGILWVSTNGYWMSANQSINLTTNISRMLTGAIFAWAGFENNASTNSNWLYFFVPKSHVTKHGGASVYMNDPYLGVAKVLHISNGIVTGHSTNNTSGTMNGIAYNNTKYTLRYVIGV